MSAAEGTGKHWEDFTSAELTEIAEALNSGGPDRTATIIRACLKPEQQPYADDIIESYEFAMSIRDLTFEQWLGTALTTAHRRGDDPAEVARRWL